MVRRKLTQVPPKLSAARRDDTVLFSFRYLHEVSFTDKRVSGTLLQSFLVRLKRLSELGWSSIAVDKRHGYGWEKIPISAIKPTIKISPSPEVRELYAFRASGDNHVFLGLRKGNVFFILFIEAEYGDIYRHS